MVFHNICKLLQCMDLLTVYRNKLPDHSIPIMDNPHHNINSQFSRCIWMISEEPLCPLRSLNRKDPNRVLILLRHNLNSSKYHNINLRNQSRKPILSNSSSR